MASLSYDLIVLGDDFAGLVAATLCATRGMRVLLAEPGKNVTSYRIGKETLPVAPLILSGLQRPAAERVIKELSFDHLMRRRLSPRNPPFQLLGPRIRLEAHPDMDMFSRALEREVGQPADWLIASSSIQESMDSLLSEGMCLPGTGFWERREIAKQMPAAATAAEEWHAASHTDIDELLATMCHLTVAHGSGSNDLSLGRSVAKTLQGLPALPGETHAWRALFLEKFQSHSGEHRILIPQLIETSWGKVTGLQAVDDQIHCDRMIAAMPAHELEPLLSAKASKRVAQVAHESRAVGYRYTLNLIVHSSALPEGLSDLASSMLDPGESPSGGNFAVISTRPAQSAGRAIVCIQGLAPVNDEGGPRLDGMRDALLAHARSLMPFLDAHIEAIDSPHELAESSIKRDLMEPLAPRPVWESPEDASLHLAAQPYASGLKQLWLASEQTLPSLGLEGQFIAAHGAAKLVSAHASKGKSSSKPSVLSASSD